MLKTVFFGTPDFVRPIIDTLHQQTTLLAILTTPDEPSGRHQTRTSPPTKKVGDELNIQVIQIDTFTPEIIEKLHQLEPDLFVVAAYGKIIPESVLKVPKYGAINIHPSLLPKYRGASPIQAAILAGDTETGVTIIQMDEKMDHGPILLQETYSLTHSDTLDSLHKTLFSKASTMLPEAIKQIETNALNPKEQNHSDATFCKIIHKDDAFIDPENLPSKQQIDRMIRAYYPWPGVWTNAMIHGEKKRIKFFPENEVQLEGKKQMGMKEFVNGYPELREFLTSFLVSD